MAPEPGVTMIAELIGGILGGLVGDAVVGRQRSAAARRNVFHSGLRVVTGHQPGLSKEWLVGEWTVRPRRLALESLTVPIIELVAGSRRQARLGEIVGGAETTVVTVRTATAELEWSTLRRFDGLALRALAAPESTTSPTVGS